MNLLKVKEAHSPKINLNPELGWKVIGRQMKKAIYFHMYTKWKAKQTGKFYNLPKNAKYVQLFGYIFNKC